MVVFDQFEEIFTIHPEYWEHREIFFNQLAEALDQDRYLRVVLLSARTTSHNSSRCCLCFRPMSAFGSNA